MRKFLLFSFALLFIAGASKAQSVAISANGGTSANIVLGTLNYHVSEYIYTEAEIGVGNFVSAPTAIDYIAFNVATVGAPTTFNNVNIYMQNTANATFTDGAYSTAGYTLVYSGSFTASATGWNGVTLGTPFVRTAGQNLAVLVERTDNATHAAYVYTSANGNNTSSTITTSRRYNSAATAPVSGSTVLTASAFRAAIQLKHLTANDIGLVNVRTLGKIARPASSPHSISATITNDGTATQTNVLVTLNITGANTFTNGQTVASIAPGATASVTFANFTPTASGSENVTVSVAADGYAGNNSMTVVQQVTPNVISTAYSTTPTQGVGFNSATGDLAVLFKNASANTVTQVTTYFNTAGQAYTVAVWDAVAGAPGTALWTSASQTAAVGANVVAVPSQAVTGDFFVVVSQTGTTNFGYAYETENPIRSGYFFFRSPGGAGTFNDFAPNNAFRVMAEATLGSSLPLSYLNFNGNDNGKQGILLNWATANEVNNDFFSIERSTNGIDFNAIGKVMSKMNSTTNNYGFADAAANTINATSFYYRLKQTDKDGRTSLSNIVQIKRNTKASFAVNVMNPVRDAVQLQINSTVDQKVQISIVNNVGQVVAERSMNITKGLTSTELDVNNLSKGTYFIRVVHADGVYVAQLIK
jgi:hypothetical protein